MAELGIHYDRERDVVTVEGVRYSGEFFRAFSVPEEQALYRFKREGETVTVGRTEGLVIWRYEDAPREYRELSGHGGDEDYVLHIPAQARNINWPAGLWAVIEGDEDSYLDGFGHVDRHELDNGDLAVIFAHA